MDSRYKNSDKSKLIPYYTWRKDKGFVINGYLKEDKDGKTNS